MYLVKTPPIVKTIFADFVWHIDTDIKEVYLTFDDGPIPGLTPWVLDVLADFKSKATFFCVGENVKKNRSIFDRIVREGHTIGNHTYNHLNGWNTENEVYLQNVAECDKYMETNLFRPPYGKMKPSQSSLIKSEKTVVMWDVLSGDFDLSITKEKCLTNVIENYSQGSVIVFHDNIKAEEKLKYVLPSFLEHLAENGFVASNLDCLIHEYA
jgi:peptidoglycan/xylan/chitin deacetylase (PgdA/CDA1 family)